MEYESGGIAASRVVRPHLEKLIDGIDRVLVTAEEFAAQVRREAQAEAESVVAKASSTAEAKAEGILTQATSKAEAILGEATSKSEGMLTEANSKAERILAEANSKAETTLADAGAKAEKLIVETDARVERVLARETERREVLETEIRVLTTRRDELAERLREVASGLGMTLSDPGASQVAVAESDRGGDEADAGPEIAPELRGPRFRRRTKTGSETPS